MTGHIFISYKTEQRDLAFRVRDQLQAWGYDTWLDVDRLQPGTYWANDIDAALKSCWACLGIMTPKSIKSRYVTNEWDMAIMQDKLFIPLMFEKTDPHYKYVDIQYISFTDSDHAQPFTQLKGRLGTYTSSPEDVSHRDPYHDYLNATFERINKFLGSTLLHTLKDDDGQPEPIRLHQERTEGAVLFEKRDEVDPFFLSAGIAEEPLREFDEFAKAFDHFNGRVLLLGEPGSGKTTTLFHYARDAVVKRRVDPNAPLPILALIVTWNAQKQTPLSEWVAHSYGAPENAKALVEQGKALLLLDGLDELGGERELEQEKKNPQTGKVITDPQTGEPEKEIIRYDPRKRFIEAIGNIDPRNNILVTCRVEDYAAIGQKIPLDGAITLQPLTDDQLRDYLTDHPEIYTAIQADEHLRELAKTPLLLSLITFAFDKLDADLKAQGDLSAGDVRDAIFEAYCKQRYEHEARKRNADLPFTYDEMMDILGELAMWNANDWRPGRYWDDDDYKPESNVLIPYDFDYVIKDSTQTTAFQEMTVQLNILAPTSDSDCRFVHLLLRDFLAYTFALPRMHDGSFWHGDDFLDKANPVNALGNLGDLRAVEPLIASLSDENERVRSSAAEALGKIDDSRAVEPLIACLSDEDRSVRSSAAEALGQLGDSRAVEPLIGCLNDENSSIRSSVVKALGKLGDSYAIEPLVTICVRDENWGVKSLAAKALGKIGDSRAVESLIEYLDDASEDVRSSTAWALDNLNWQSESDEQELKYLIASQSWNALATKGTLAVEPLIGCLSYDDWNVRRLAAKALGKIGDSRAVEPLIVCLSDEDNDVRGSAGAALGKIGDARAVEPLIACLSDDAWGVRSYAVSALGDIGDSRAVEPLIVCLSDENSHMRSSAASALGKIEDSRAVEPLIACLSDTDRSVRRSAARVLGELGDSYAVEPLIACLSDEDKYVRLSAARALGNIGDTRVVEPLVVLLDDEEKRSWGKHRVCDRAYEALQELGTPKALQACEDWIAQGNEYHPIEDDE